MKRQLFSLAICLILVSGSLTFSINTVSAPSGDGVVEVDVPPRGTFLHAIDGFPYDGGGYKEYNDNLELYEIVAQYYTVEDPAIVDLNAEGFTEGDKIMISYTAEVYYSGAYNPSNPSSTGWGLRDEYELFWGGLLGIFSTTPTLLGIKQTNRVPDAVDSGVRTFMSPTTKWNDALQDISDKLRVNQIDWYNGPEDTDIDYDFKIAPPYGFEMIIPRNARFLFLCCIDDMYYDNLGEIKVTIEKDTDLDGIPDHWEINGIDVDEDGTVDLDFAVLGADWQHKDIFVEVDYMSHFRPNQFALDAVIDAFDNSPVTNPDMASGVNLHIIVDEEIPYKEVISGFDEFYRLKSDYFGTNEERLDQKTIEAKKKIFRYCLSVDKIWFNPPDNNVPGVAEGIACDDFIVAYGALSRPTIEAQAALFMHELGHTLGLHHGGGDDVNYKPNYLSIMNYKFQFNDLLSERPLDYSRKELPPIDESNINEAVGIGSATKTVWYELSIDYPSGVWFVSSGNIPIDWNHDGNITSGRGFNVHDYPHCGYQPYTTLVGYNDWENLVYRFRGRPLYQRGATQEDYHIELTDSEIELMKEDSKNIIVVPAPQSYVPENQNENIGIRKGDWIEYSAWYTGAPPDTLSSRFKIRMDEIVGTQITVSAEGQNLDGEDWSISETYDLKTGFHDLLLIPVGLNIGDQFYHEEFGNIVIQGVEKNRYAGEERTVVWSTFSGHTLYWDQDTGVLCQADWNLSSDYEARWTLEKTSLWGQIGIGWILNFLSQIGLDPTLLAVLVIAVIGIIIILVYIKRKRKKQKFDDASKI